MLSSVYIKEIQALLTSAILVSEVVSCLQNTTFVCAMDVSENINVVMQLYC